MTWNEIIDELQIKYEFKKIPPLSQTEVGANIGGLGLGSDFIKFYLVTNGLSCEWFRILPIEDPNNIKNTWDGLKKANDLNKTKFEVDECFLDRFVVFAEIGGGQCAVFDKLDGSIWYEEEEEFVKTDLTLKSLIEICLKEVKEL